MSFDAIRWALAQAGLKSSAKFVLVAMADCVNSEDGPEMLCWPSYRHLTERTGQDLKTVESGMKRLRESGLIEDTGERQGRTGSVVVYRLRDTKNGVALPRPDPRQKPATGTKNGGTLPATNPTVVATSNPVFGATSLNDSDPGFPASAPVFPVKRPQISTEATPKTGGGTSNRTSNGIRKEPGVDPRLSAVPTNFLVDYLKVRKAKKAGEFTSTAIDGMEREAGKAGLSLADAVRVCAELGWQGFNAGWYEQRMARNRPTQPTETPYQRSMREKWETATGRNRPSQGDLIDVTPVALGG